MGFFSWLTADTKKSIRCIYANEKPSTCYWIWPKADGNSTRPGIAPKDGRIITVTNYDGYGEIWDHVRETERDVFATLAQWNAPKECTGNVEHDRLIGIEMYHHGKPMYGLKFLEHFPFLYDGKYFNYYQNSESDPSQGFFESELQPCPRVSAPDYQHREAPRVHYLHSHLNEEIGSFILSTGIHPVTEQDDYIVSAEIQDFEGNTIEESRVSSYSDEQEAFDYAAAYSALYDVPLIDMIKQAIPRRDVTV